ncbi:hypothetical protein [Methylorubrum extorquens]|uniref:Uncharacterized protein n=1 Tax=Methylorubrum extorquens TaxID=408 RepID=A0AAX3WBF6_METEX|nr:hypothetical protein [Methylorubrum extorquens]WHQ68623.1 hypothetical protein KEC54_19955 [Methylorubrum extorquens]
MPVQPPRGHFPACIAPLYVLARALHDAFPSKEKAKFDLKPFSSKIILKPTATALHNGELRNFNLTVSGFTPSRIGVEVHLDLTLAPRIVPRSLPPSPRMRKEASHEPMIEAQPPAVVEAEDDENEWLEEDPEEAAASAAATAARAEADERRPKRATVLLAPPFDTCLKSEHLSAAARWRGLLGLPQTARGGRTLSTPVAFKLPSVQVMLVEEMRDVLAEGGGRAILLEAAGDVTPVPARYWRSEAAEAVLAAGVRTVVPLESGREATGTIWFDEVALDAAWRQMRSTAAALVKPGEPAEKRPTHTAVPQPTPWMIFMQQIALEFGYSGGRPVGPNRLSREELTERIRTRWPKVLGDWSETYAQALAAFVLHPSNRKAGNPNATTKSERERTQARLAAEKEKIAGMKIRQ